jgi:citrate lyase beta subunit
MDRIILNELDRETAGDAPSTFSNPAARSPIHVLYGGAHLFKSDTAQKLGRLALESIESYAPNFAEFARAVWLSGADALPRFDDAVEDLEFQLADDPEKVKTENENAHLAWTIYTRTVEKLKSEAIEDFRIDFEDGYGRRSDEEEDAHALASSDELAKSFLERTITPFCGFRIKSFAPETHRRATATLDLFLANLIKKTGGRIPENFVVTLPKITRDDEVKDLRKRLEKFEEENDLPGGAIKIEIMIETPQAIVSEKGKIAPGKLVKAGNGRVASAHFGAFDYTAALGISGAHQHLRHEACNFARQMMLVSLAPLGVRVSDSVTTELPLAVHKGENLSEKQARENKFAVQKAWRAHFNNVTHSLIGGFYQSWDLHPAQLPARYAAVYSFFLEARDEQGARLKNFIEKAARAVATGGAFDDAASVEGLLNFFGRASSCGALTETEIAEATGLSPDELAAASFSQIMNGRQKTNAKFI